MSDVLLVIDSSEITPGKADQVKALINEMVEFVETNESRPIAYNVYVDEAGTRMTVAQIHPDPASMEEHMTVAAPVFARFQGLITLSTMDVYGKPSAELLHALQTKARMLGTAKLVVHELHGGFMRFSATG